MKVRLSRLRHRRIQMTPAATALNGFADWVQAIETVFEKNYPAEILKNDHFSTVLRVAIPAASVVVKKELFRSRLDAWKSSLRRSRAAKTWQKSLLLSTRQLNTITPLALVEDRCLFFRLNAFFLSADIKGPLLSTCLAEPGLSQDRDCLLADKVLGLVQDWHQQGICHGDPKASNIIIGPQALYLIDPEDARCRPAGGRQKRDRLRDWSIALYSWHHRPQTRRYMLKQILQILADGHGPLATRLIKKFWKTAGKDAGWHLKPDSGTQKQLALWLSGQTPAGWKRLPARPGQIRATCETTADCCLISRRGIRHRCFKPPYFKKGRHPRRGVLSMALCLNICGFNLPEISASGHTARAEYLFYTESGLMAWEAAWEAAQMRPDGKNQLLTELGAEVGRFHAMGFVHGALALGHVGFKPHGAGYDVYFALTGAIRRPRFFRRQQADRDLRPLYQALKTRLTAGQLDQFVAAYQKWRRR